MSVGDPLLQIDIQRDRDVFSVQYSGFKQIDIRPFDLDRDSEMVHNWVKQDYARFWGMTGMTTDEVKNAYQKTVNKSGHNVYIGEFADSRKAVFLLESYCPKQDILGDYYQVLDSDIGTHRMMAPPTETIKNFSWYCNMVMNEFQFSDPDIQRIVAEPDVSNLKVAAVFAQCGFNFGKALYLPHKTARFAYITRERFNEFRQRLPHAKRISSFQKLHARFHERVGDVVEKYRRLSGQSD